MAIRTTMAHKVGSNPGTLSHGRIVGQPSSRNVINTSAKKTGGRADGFAYRKGDCIKFKGGPGTKYQD